MICPLPNEGQFADDTYESIFVALLNFMFNTNELLTDYLRILQIRVRNTHLNI